MATESEQREEMTFTWPLVGALYGSLVIVAVLAILNSHIGRSLDNKVGAPARTLIAAPVIFGATVVFLASLVGLISPGFRRSALRVAEIAGWLIPAWLVMGGMVLGAVSFALHHAH
jgi:hypothetical protein